MNIYYLNKTQQQVQDILNKIEDLYPVGYIYETTDSSVTTDWLTDKYGGSWLKIDSSTSGVRYDRFSPTTLTASNVSVSKSITVTRSGTNPIFLNINGDINPSTSSGWILIDIYKGTTILARQIAESHQHSQNIPFSVSYLDTNVMGTSGSVTYKFELTRGDGDIQIAEDGTDSAPRIVAFEIGTPNLNTLYRFRRTS